MHGEDQRIATRNVIENRLSWRIGENSAIPIELAIDADWPEKPVAARLTP